MKIASSSVILLLLCVMMPLSCRGDKEGALVKKCLAFSGNNKGNLEKVLFHDEWNSMQSDAARFLVANMPASFSYDTTRLKEYRYILYELDSLRQSVGKQKALNIINQKWKKINAEQSFANIYSNRSFDILTVSSDYLIKNIKQAFDCWQNSVFKDSIDYETFKQYILPHRIKNGYIVEDWRSFFVGRFGDNYNKYSSVIEMVDSVMNLVDEYQVDWQAISGYPFLCLSDYEMAKMSKCPERCWFNAMLLRSLGLPCAIDFVPAWGNRNSGHEWNAIVVNGKTYPFESTGGDGKWKPKQVYNNEWVDEYWMKSRLPKVFRYTYEINQEGPEIKDAPALFKQQNYADVSSEYFKTTDVQIENKYVKARKAPYAYLCVFNEDQWKPVHWGKKQRGEEYEFLKMGRNIVYLPAFYENGRLIPINDAFILDSLGKIKYLIPDTLTTRRVKVIRKYLTRPDLDFWRKWNLGSRFEIAADKSFNKPHELFTVDEVEMHPVITHLEEPVSTRYLRYVFSKNYDCLAELYFYSADNSGNLSRVKKKAVIAKGELDSCQIEKLFDDDILTFASFPKPEESPFWIGFDFGKPIKIDAVGICPRNDKNDIIKGLAYELFYWDKRWISVGIKTADDYYMVFDNVPQNALLFAKCLTEGKENRIFTFQNNRQIWW